MKQGLKKTDLNGDCNDVIELTFSYEDFLNLMKEMKISDELLRKIMDRCASLHERYLKDNGHRPINRLMDSSKSPNCRAYVLDIKVDIDKGESPIDIVKKMFSRTIEFIIKDIEQTENQGSADFPGW